MILNLLLVILTLGLNLMHNRNSEHSHKELGGELVGPKKKKGSTDITISNVYTQICEYMKRNKK